MLNDPPTDTDENAWKQWKAAPSPQANAVMLDRLDPQITRAATAHAGRIDPIIKGRARSMTLSALKTYDPSKSKLGTHVYNQLQGLKRYAAQTASGIHVPERIVLDRRRLSMASSDLQDQLGREPTEDELADHSGMSVKKIRRTQGANSGLSEGYIQSVMGGEDGSDEAGTLPMSSIPGAGGGQQAWEDLVVSDMAPMDKKIVEYHRKGMTNQQIAAKLRYTPGYVSQRKAVIQKSLDQESDFNLF